MLIPTVGTLVIRNGVAAVLFLEELKNECKVIKFFIKKNII
jgi:hypothetical protein